jgi:hypothetical protein
VNTALDVGDDADPDAHLFDSRVEARLRRPLENAGAQSDHSSDNNADDSPRFLSPSTDDNYQVRDGDLGRNA